jgi:hypothetical protein
MKRFLKSLQYNGYTHYEVTGYTHVTKNGKAVRTRPQPTFEESTELVTAEVPA